MLSDVLGRQLTRSHSSLSRIAKLAGVPKQTLANWVERRIQHPRKWQDLVRVAAALHLTMEEANTLLNAGGHASLASLQRGAEAEDQALFDPWARDFSLPAALSPSPFQAVADVPEFVGRVAELNQLRPCLLKTGRVTIVGQSALAGIGKTALAAHLAVDLRDAFPDGVLWARLDAADTYSVLAKFALPYGKDLRRLDDVESRAAVVRDLLNRKRALIILDNAETSIQVRPLLPPSTSPCSVIVTSRSPLAVADGWTQIDLAPFEPETGEALLLFEKRLGPARARRHQSPLAAIADQLGHWPLALAVAAGYLADQPSTAIEQLRVTLLRNEHRLARRKARDRWVRLAFAVSFSSLRPFEQAFFAKLGNYGTEDFDVDAAAEAARTTVVRALSILRRFQRRSLVQLSRSDRWHLHPLLADFAQERASARSAN